jgi:hypothetical protein
MELRVFFCHLVCFNVSTISCLIYTEKIFDLVPHVHKHSLSQYLCIYQFFGWAEALYKSDLELFPSTLMTTETSPPVTQFFRF